MEKPKSSSCFVCFDLQPPLNGPAEIAHKLPELDGKVKARRGRQGSDEQGIENPQLNS